MCIALNEFEALMGFAANNEIIEFLKEFQLLNNVKQDNLIKQLEGDDEIGIKTALKEFLTELFSLPKEELSLLINKMMK